MGSVARLCGFTRLEMPPPPQRQSPPLAPATRRPALYRRAASSPADFGLPDHLVVEIEGRVKAQTKRLSKVFGLMFPPFFGCTRAYELTRVRGWDKHLPSRLLGALPKRSWMKRLRQLGQDILVPRWRHVESRSAAPQSRWPWSGVWDDTVFRQYGQDFELVGRWYSGQHKRVVSGMDGVLLVVVTALLLTQSIERKTQTQKHTHVVSERVMFQICTSWV